MQKATGETEVVIKIKLAELDTVLRHLAQGKWSEVNPIILSLDSQARESLPPQEG